MNTSRTTQTETPRPKIQEERAHLLNILAPSLATEFFAENGAPSEPAIENQQLTGEPKVSPSEPQASPAESEPSPGDPGASPAHFPHLELPAAETQTATPYIQEKRAHLPNLLASSFDTETDLKYSNFEPPACSSASGKKRKWQNKRAMRAYHWISTTSWWAISGR